MSRLTSTTLGPFRKRLAAQQKNVSPLSGRELHDPVLDHCHKTGNVRAVINRWENGVLGRLENWSGRIGQGIDPVEFLRSCAEYLTHHRDNPQDVQYPTHKTDDEKKALRADKARKARRAARVAKAAE